MSKAVCSLGRPISLRSLCVEQDSVTKFFSPPLKKFLDPGLASHSAECDMPRLSNPDERQAVGVLWASNLALLVVRPAGFEPATVRLRGDCSTN